MNGNTKRSVTDQLKTSREELLDLSKRNRLLHTSRSSSRSTRLEIKGESAEQIFDVLACKGKKMDFLSDPKADERERRKREKAKLDAERAAQGKDIEEAQGDEAAENEISTDIESQLTQPNYDEQSEADRIARQSDLHLQTGISSTLLQKRLLTLFRDSQNLIQEQGVNTLYLAIGFLKWFEDTKSTQERWGPLLLLPVELQRESAGARFSLKYTEDDIKTNLTLQTYLKSDFGIKLPNIPDDITGWTPYAYFDEVAKSVTSEERWEVCCDDMVLWHFSFSKFLMYNDLDPASWPEGTSLEDNPIISGILGGNFRFEPPIFGDTGNIDSCIPISNQIHVLDADSSQAMAIEEIRQGRSLVIQGPPGTGKSQTIANVIATSVKEGKRVLFVAEKMAALEVVKKRLENLGLGDICLELHSNKARKAEVLGELNKTKMLSAPQRQSCDTIESLQECRQHLNDYCEILHQPILQSELTPRNTISRLVQLRNDATPTPSFRLTKDALNWTAKNYRQCHGLVEQLAAALDKVGVPAEHPWRGMQLKSMLPMERDRVLQNIEEAVEKLGRLLDKTKQLRSALKIDNAFSPSRTVEFTNFIMKTFQAPAMDYERLADEIWQRKEGDIRKVVDIGKNWSKTRVILVERVTEEAFASDVKPIRDALRKHGHRMLRWFNRDYRRASGNFRLLLKGKAPATLKERIELLNEILTSKQQHEVILSEKCKQLGQSAFGVYWNDDQSDWELFTKTLQWNDDIQSSKVPWDVRKYLPRLKESGEIQNVIKTIRKELRPTFESIKKLASELKMNLNDAFGVKELTQIAWSDLHERLNIWLSTPPEQAGNWCEYYRSVSELISQKMEQLAYQVHTGKVNASSLLKCFELLYYEAIIQQAFNQSELLRNFSGTNFQRMRDRFCELEHRRIELARHEVALAHYQGIPRENIGAGEMSVIERECNKKRAHMPIRKLLTEAGNAVQRIKPVFMMSPLSVAQYLAPGKIEFDLLLIDEASQVRPADALGAMARSKQVVVVGDDKQMPPTNFFARTIESDDSGSEGDGDQYVTRNIESVLGLCCASGVPQKMLRWHYRSKHHSLIAVSNHAFYDDRLFIIPSPKSIDHRYGLRFHHVKDGIYDRGGSRTNVIEARMVADAVMRHAEETPNKTLGIGTFSQTQCTAILDELELRRRSAPHLESFFSENSDEPFFVKNLENIQGDERDMIMISIGYGRDADGRFLMNFGPLSGEGGERRLNVLITRSRQQCIVYSSITSNAGHDAIDKDGSRFQIKGRRVIHKKSHVGPIVIGHGN